MTTSHRTTPFTIDVVTGIDTYVNEEQKTKTLALSSKDRTNFFEKHPQIKNLLLREHENPLIEEGYYSETKRAREGEYYLTYESLILLIDIKIRQQYKTKYNTNNIFVFNNTMDTLSKIIDKNPLKENDDMKIIFISGIHAIPIYFRKINNKIRCFIIDSEADAFGWPTELINKLNSIFYGIQITLSSTLLQKDFYSCSTFAFKAIRYFVKHGDEIFPYLDKKKMTFDDKTRCDILDSSDLMPDLLKMHQGNLSLSNETLKSIVSHKNKLTLKDYLEKYTFDKENKTYNTAALVKKYRYFIELNEFIGKEKITQSKLPLSIKKLCDLYDPPTQKENKTNKLIKFDDYLEITKALDDNNKSNLPKYLQDKASSIIESYHEFITKLDSNIDSELKKVNKLFFAIAYREMDDIKHFDDYIKFGNTLYNLFDKYDKIYDTIVEYIKRHAVFRPDANQPVRDICLFTLPEEKAEWNKSYWADLTLTYGKSITPYLSIAHKIDAQKDEQTHINDNLQRTMKLALNIKYKNSSKNPELAELCLINKYSEDLFEEILRVINTGFKKMDFLPNITIPGKNIDSSLGDFTLSKLPAIDLRGLFLGEYTDCCQSYKGKGKRVAIDGMTSLTSGFYIIVNNRKRIIAQFYAWIINGDFVVDSFEFANKDQAYICAPFMKAFAKEVLKHGFKRVLIGRGGHTPKSLKFQQSTKPTSNEHIPYPDAKQQLLIKESKNQEHKILFQRFCTMNDLSYKQYESLFESKQNQDEVLMQFLKKPIDYNDYTKIIQFFYMHGNTILHDNIKFADAFIQAYQDKKFSFFLLKDFITKLPLLEFFVENNADSIKEILLKNGKDLLNCILPILETAIRRNKMQIITTIFTAGLLGKNGFDNLFTSEGVPLLLYAADAKSLEAMHFIIDKIKVMSSSEPDYDSLSDAQKLSNQLNQMIKANYNIIYSKTYRYITHNLSSSMKMKDLTQYCYSDKPLIEYILKEDLVDLLSYLSPFISYKEWEVPLSNYYKYSYSLQSPLGFSFNAKSARCVLYYLSTLDFDSIDSTLQKTRVTIAETYRFKASAEEFAAIIEKLLDLYKDNKNKFFSLFDDFNYAAIHCFLLLHNNIKTFTRLITYDEKMSKDKLSESFSYFSGYLITLCHDNDEFKIILQHLKEFGLFDQFLKYESLIERLLHKARKSYYHDDDYQFFMALWDLCDSKQKNYLVSTINASKLEDKEITFVLSKITEFYSEANKNLLTSNSSTMFQPMTTQTKDCNSSITNSLSYSSKPS